MTTYSMRVKKTGFGMVQFSLVQHIPAEEDNLPENDGVFHEGEEDQVWYGLVRFDLVCFIPAEEDNLSEDDGVLHEGEEDEQHAGQEPHLQRCHRVRHRDSCPENIASQFRELN